MVGSPALAANGRGVQELAPDLALLDPTAEGGALAQPAGALLLIGPGQWPALPGRRVILATNGPFDERDEIEVVLPLTHPYEQAGSLTNLEGRVQKLEPSGFAAPTTLADWAALARVANALGADAPADIPRIRAALSAAHPTFATALTASLPRGRLLERAEVA
jgi:NADH dehydrogenase/NADH:ubiquinone oxidoreductase subunit G